MIDSALYLLTHLEEPFGAPTWQVVCALGAAWAWGFITGQVFEDVKFALAARRRGWRPPEEE